VAHMNVVCIPPVGNTDCRLNSPVILVLEQKVKRDFSTRLLLLVRRIAIPLLINRANVYISDYSALHYLRVRTGVGKQGYQKC